MNARGERILIFGDSLTHHGHDSGPEVWNVDTGSMRSSSAPGDLLASLLAEQGAAAVRTNARVSRSAWNFWNREAAGQLIAADIAWKPTKVIVMLGTNDVGLDPQKDRDAFTAIREAYRKAGAEVWAIGPFISNKPPAGIETVVQTMSSVFGMRFIDGRPLSELAQRAGDGLHYTTNGARTLALTLADTLLRKTSPTTMMKGIGWGLLGLGVALIAGYAAHRKGFYTLNGEGAEVLGVDEDDVIDAEFTELGDVRGLLASSDRYRVAYGLVTRRDGQIVTVRAFVDAPRGLTLAEAEAWRRKWSKGSGQTTWIETMDGAHVPVTGAKKPGRYVDDARSGDTRAAMSSTPPELEGPEDKPRIDDEDFGSDDWFERLNKKSNARKAAMREALATHDAVFITSGTRKILLVKTPEMSNPEEGAVRVMTFDDDGPIGHTTRPTLDKIADELARDWHPDTIEPATMAEVDAFTGTEKFAKGSAAVIAVQKANAGLKGNKTKVRLVGPRGQDLKLTVDVIAAGPTVGIKTEDGRTFFYDKLMSDEVPTYREYVEHVELNGPEGSCFPWAYANAHGGKLKHGMVTHPWSGKAYEHAWVERDGRVYDWQTSVGLGPGQTGWSREDFYAKYKPIKIKTYEAARLASKSWLQHGPGLKGSTALRWKKISPGVYHATSPVGRYVIDGNNAGRNRWTVTYPDGDYGMVDALAEAKLWAAQHDEERVKPVELKGKRVKKLKCPECDGGLTMDDPWYGLTCDACGIKVAGPFDSANDIPPYKRAKKTG